jgi:hypothetical protein
VTRRDCPQSNKTITTIQPQSAIISGFVGDLLRGGEARSWRVLRIPEALRITIGGSNEQEDHLVCRWHLEHTPWSC